jgi:HAD superfamily hydrolase (TIGR01509 family)
MKKLSAVDAILWDNDGVLVDTEKLYFRASRDTLAEAGIDLTWDMFLEISLRQGQSVFTLAKKSGLSQQKCEQLRLKRNHHYTQLLQEEATVINGVEETLQHLHGKIPMAIVTSSQRDHFDIIHRHSGLLGFFDFVLTREDYGQSKPHPEPYLTALARLDIPAHRCLVVEDSERGLQSARQARIPCIVVSSNHGSGDFAGAHAIVPAIVDIPSLLPQT